MLFAFASGSGLFSGLLAAAMLMWVVVDKGRFTIVYAPDAFCVSCGDIFAWPYWPYQTISILLGGIVAPLIQLSVVVWFCRRCWHQFRL
ncbi:MAG TPA: hypothetical protein VGO96_04080 [Pyrinomonadaceae bacterium]|nr:hypothetical protein [Pyrinomonadaceae bacterium]